MLVDRVGRLCLSLTRDPDLPAVLEDAGLPAAHWDSLVEAVRGGATAEVLEPVLDAVDEAAAAAGLDGVTTGDRRFQPLPGTGPGVRTARAWRCPHPHRCGRVELPGAVPAPECPLTEDPLTPVKLVSG